MRITSIDHIVLTVADIEKTIQFYTEVLGFELITFGDNRKDVNLNLKLCFLHLVLQIYVLLRKPA
ncbi:VOC family protein [Elizabethkingia miricola]|uniref:VOC family protein n=1 Tax=Elizabethkingia miricola TaxID=172045 RepID=UPI001F338F3D|nr:VOC family protein [Elizabethkingia miricola]UIO98282.1 VOC family protein [Elizabethkingia miricola]WER15060.1 VOC family protein [Elizabethkingia miricola]WGL75235.1 VOC family protein [Elizabethkingia miricola]WNG66993.1 VOC family protein [Elizabethkingia miricola]